MSFVPQNNFGVYVPTTNVFDAAAIYSLDIHSAEFKEFLVLLRQNINNIALVLNMKETGYYPLAEFVSGKMWFPSAVANNAQNPPSYRPGFLAVVDTGTLPNNSTKSVPHGLAIGTTYNATHIWGAATDPVGLKLIPLAYSSPILADNIAIDVDATNVNITTGSDRTNFTISRVVIEYLKQ